MKIGVGSSKKARAAKGRAKEAENHLSKKEKRQGGSSRVRLSIGKRTARVAPVRTIFVAGAADDESGKESPGKCWTTVDPVLWKGMASNGIDEEEQQDMGLVDAELSPGNNGKGVVIAHILQCKQKACFQQLQCIALGLVSIN